MSETTVTPGTLLFGDFDSKIKEGSLLIPQFQRDFVWSMKNSAELIDSIIKGYPIGTFIFWHTNERLSHFRCIGDQALPPPGEGAFVDLVLDGQQRMKCIYACFKGARVQCKGSRQPGDFGKICVDLDACDNERIVRADIANPEVGGRYMPVKYLFDFSDFVDQIPKERLKKIMAYSKKIAGYKFSVVGMSGARLDVATEAFTRINTKGRRLKTFEIMVAKTYDEERFDLAKEWDALHASLEKTGYGTVDSETALRTVALIADQNCTKAHILNMGKEKFIKNWFKAVDAINRAVDYFQACRIPASSVLPYNALVASYAYFFSRATRSPSNTQKKFLEDFFWRVAFTNRYRDSVESNLAKDITHMDSFLDEKQADYDPADWKVSVQPQDIINNGSFASGNIYGSAYCKAILCLYLFHRPQSFDNGNDVAINNKSLSRGNSKNYHHFFPKAFLRQNQEPEKRIDHILNITIVGENLNHRIGARRPSIYMDEFKRENSSLAETMRTHLISDLDGFGVFKNDYDKFLNQRAKIVSEELSKRMILRKDNEWQPNSNDQEKKAE